MSHQDDVFAKIFIGVLVALTIFMIAAMILANSIGDPNYEGLSGSKLSKEATEARIKPVGELSVAGAATEAVAAAAPVAAKSGDEVYNTFCLACHATGAAGAPIMGDAAAWTDRVAQGFDTVLANAINGKGAMPARGGNPALSDEEVRNAVALMFDKVGAAH